MNRGDNIDPQYQPLREIPGLRIPDGVAIWHRGCIIAVNRGGAFLPYTHEGSFTILEPNVMRSVANPYAFIVLHVSTNQWLLYMHAYARETQVGTQSHS